MEIVEFLMARRKWRNIHRINKRIAERKQADAEPTWINMTEDIKKDFLEAVAKIHNIETKDILSNSINATT